MIDLEDYVADVAQSAYGWPESLRFTYDKVRELIAAGVTGDLVECGVAAGAHPAMMDRACTDAGESRAIRLFDSFQGVPNGGERDVEWNAAWGDGSGRLEPTGVAAASLPAVQENLERWGCDGERFSFFVGWFQQTLPPVAAAWRAKHGAGEAEGIAFLRLDGDLYESTLVCLRQLYPLVVSGGVIVVDDWNLDGCRSAVADYFAESELWPHKLDVTAIGDAEPRTMPSILPQTITESGDVWWTKP